LSTGAGGPAQRFRASLEAVYNRTGDEGILIHMKTNRIHELNRTTARMWELLQAGNDRDAIQRTMLQEFDVTEVQLAREVDELLARLQEEQLIYPDLGG